MDTCVQKGKQLIPEVTALFSSDYASNTAGTIPKLPQEPPLIAAPTPPNHSQKLN